MSAVITKPGLVYDLDEAVYRAQHDWLSVSGAKKLLPPSCPAKFKATVGVEEHKPQYDVGKAFHAKVLGAGADVVVVNADSWRSKAAQEARDAAYMAGSVPLLAADAELVDAMAAAVLSHDVAKHLFVGGAAEVSAFWVDEATGVKCKARFDYLPEKQDGKRLIVPDLKSAVSSEPDEFSRAAARFGYLSQADWYCGGLATLGIDDDAAFVFCVVEKEDPHVVTVGQFTDRSDLELAAALNDKARRIYRKCADTDTWPGYVPGVASLTLPTWLHYQMEDVIAS